MSKKGPSESKSDKPYTMLPSLPLTRTTPLVFLLVFFFPSGVRVDKHVLHGFSPGNAVKHSIWGKLEDVPVPRKINSNPSSTCFNAGDDITAIIQSGCQRGTRYAGTGRVAKKVRVRRSNRKGAIIEFGANGLFLCGEGSRFYIPHNLS